MVAPGQEPSHSSAKSDNQVLPDIWAQPIWWRLLERRLEPGAAVLLLGARDDTGTLGAALVELGRDVDSREWLWSTSVDLGALAANTQVVVCHVPATAADWRAMAALRDLYGPTVASAYELVLPFTALTHAQSVLPYQQATIDALMPYYLGETYHGPMEELDAVVSLSGKSVIEFGPMEGMQTAALVNAGARSVTCIEARAENMLKMVVGRYVCGWDAVDLIMDDFHNVHGSKYGTFDLAFAHGVYYHSNAPFVFLENLVSLSSRIFIGGFCATEEHLGPYEALQHEGRTYRAKRYNENMVESYVRGVNDVGWVFAPEDLLAFFTERGYETHIIQEGESPAFAGKYLHFLATRTA